MSLLNPPPVGVTDFGKKADTAATDDTGSWSLIALVKRLLQKLTSGISTNSPGSLAVVSGSVTRPAGAGTYATGQLVANNATAASVTPIQLTGIARAAGEAVRIERLRLRKSTASLTNAAFRVHLFNAAPTVTAGDLAAFNAAGVLAVSDIAMRVGSFDVTMDAAGANGAMGIGVPSSGNGVTAVPAAGTNLFALIEARGAYAAGAAEQFTVIAEALRP